MVTPSASDRDSERSDAESRGPGDAFTGTDVATGADAATSAATGTDVATGGATDAASDADRLFRRALWTIPTGLVLVGSRAGSRWNLMTASWFTQVATVPRQVGIGLEARSLTLSLVRSSAAFAVSMLDRRDRDVVRRFVRPVPADAVHVGPDGLGTMRDVPVRSGPTGSPVIANAVAWVDCRVAHELDLGSHVWVVGEVVAAGLGPEAADTHVLTMADTRMNYGG
jgi:flavin reductase (DIM6/NTAB) family NADH-FMN oxidoreductase RutF